MSKLRDGEHDIIESLMSFSPFIGDDACVLKDRNLLISKDLFVQDTHFRLRYFDEYSIAYKALHINFSDILAMHGYPSSIFIGIGGQSQQYIANVMNHICAICKERNVILMGGDIVKAPYLAISVTVLGGIYDDRIVYRHGAQCDDIICVAGNIGDASVGLHCLENNISGYEQYKNNVLYPQYFLQESKLIGKYASSMMDISDGLLLDLKKLCASSDVGFVLNLCDIEFDQQYLQSCDALSLNHYKQALEGGDDYGLLFTIPQNYMNEFKYAFHAKHSDTKLHIIGKIQQQKNIILKDQCVVNDDFTSFSHF